ncbi:hypothetical protein [Petrocella sp. FN5]|uniref:hypothetical protein n=1 Tax=Petrocella sp. FN5 TaxID=3032002 RepID=UPI0023DBAFB8|nr:hypothetical protein [Petrocella sp. FN5]MDF1617792.1 hypothetical protein [Petrocella sp. FN5]
MAYLVLSRREIAALSLVCGKKLNTLSPMHRMDAFNSRSIKSDLKSMTETMNQFIEDGAIWRNAEGVPKLIRELQGVFTVIHTPDKVIRIKKASKEPFSEHYYVHKNEIGVIISINKEEDCYTLGYPITESSLGTWIMDEMIGEIPEKDKKEMRVSWNLENEEFELLALLITGQNYQYYRGTNQILSRNNILDEATLAYIREHNIFHPNQEIINKLENQAYMNQWLPSLDDKGLIRLDGDLIILHSVLGDGFINPRLKDIIEITEMSPFMRGKQLYVTEAGLIIIEPCMTNPMVWKIGIEGLKTTPKTLIDRLLQFGPVEINKTFKEAIKTGLNNHQ